MKNFLVAGAAASLLITADPVRAADWPVRPLPPAVVIPIFTWSSCYLGASVGYGWAHKDITDPVELVQDLLNGAGGLGLPPTSRMGSVQRQAGPGPMCGSACNTSGTRGSMAPRLVRKTTTPCSSMHGSPCREMSACEGRVL